MPAGKGIVPPGAVVVEVDDTVDAGQRFEVQVTEIHVCPGGHLDQGAVPDVALDTAGGHVVVKARGHTNGEVSRHVGRCFKHKVTGPEEHIEARGRIGGFQLVFLRGVVHPREVLFSRAGEHTEAAVDVSRLSVGHVLGKLVRTDVKHQLVKQNKFGVDIVSDVPCPEEQLCIDHTVLVGRSIDRVKHTQGVVKGDHAASDIEERLHGGVING